MKPSFRRRIELNVRKGARWFLRPLRKRRLAKEQERRLAKARAESPLRRLAKTEKRMKMRKSTIKEMLNTMGDLRFMSRQGRLAANERLDRIFREARSRGISRNDKELLEYLRQLFVKNRTAQNVFSEKVGQGKDGRTAAMETLGLILEDYGRAISKESLKNRELYDATVPRSGWGRVAIRDMRRAYNILAELG